MRFEGTLKTWNGQRGFGFIGLSNGSQEIFVRISAFPRDGREPAVGEALTFEIESTAEGKKRAVRVQRAGQVSGQAAPARRPGQHLPASGKSGFGSAVVALAIVSALGWYAYGQYSQRAEMQRASRQAPELVRQESRQPVASFQCDGRTYCSQMTSCAEAKFFLKNCPGTRMDGNHDGVPCEQQWCSSPFAK